ncbi:MAG: Nif11-like leader peptide family natural product precursor [Gammaproteobacteria bacterium]|nr:Nif11-like leader peptide family natural product precursor [Gammaproteobacteria bacterium]
MSIENAQAFKREVYKNPQLVREYTAILSTEQDMEIIAEKIAQWGGSHGYDFTAKDALAVRNRVLASVEKDELEDDELELIAGGKNAGDAINNATDAIFDGVQTGVQYAFNSLEDGIYTVQKGVSDAAEQAAKVVKKHGKSAMKKAANAVANFFKGW